MRLKIWRWTDAAKGRSLYELLETLPDYRRDKGKIQHHVQDVVMIMILAYACGKSSLRRAHEWARRNKKKLIKYLKLQHGIPSVSTIQRVMAHIKEADLNDVLMEWTAQFITFVNRQLIIDGKALRGSTQRIIDGSTPYVLNVIDKATRIVIAQMSIPAKTNEITAIPEMLRMLDLRGNIITIDAIGTQVEIMEYVLDQGGHFVLTVKKNQPSLYEEITGYFRQIEKTMSNPMPTTMKEKEYLDFLLKNFDKYEKSERNRERHEYRSMKVFRYPVLAVRDEDIFRRVNTVGVSDQVRIRIEKDKDGNDITPDKKTFLKRGSVRHPKVSEGDQLTDDHEVVGMISDLKLSAEEMQNVKRSHWQVECMHHTLDDTLGEDRSTAKVGKSSYALIRRFAYNLMKLHQGNEIEYDPDNSFAIVADEFCEDFNLLRKFAFKPITAVL